MSQQILSRGLPRRVIAVATAVMAILAVMTVLAPPALAHHPEVQAVSSDCVENLPVIHVTSESWSHTADGRNNPNIGVYIKKTGEADSTYVQVGAGAYTDGNNQEFSIPVSSATVAANDWAGMNVTVKVQADANWANGVEGGQIRTTTLDVNSVEDCEPPSTTTTTAAESTTTTTTGDSTTTTAEEPTTTSPEETTSTFEDEVSPTVVTTTTSIPDEVSPTEVLPSTLPFTGAGTENLSLLALVLTGVGILFLVATRRTEE